MSSTAAWSYTNTAKVKPLIGFDQWTQETTYGEEYEIACTWEAKSEQMRDSNGAEFVTKNIIYTEDARPKHLDLIKLNGKDNFEEIRAVNSFDMSFFNETPDFELVT
ncbi:hypothetical protein [Vibrio paracholerae]|uniref:hypothetical protein n=1 Tax=Vibrio paracholerae TaxID=650003 RepID=UPI002094A4DA|nr:hypothetical protein [Vibrio paracholerae]MCO7020294.1 hypothetical protein [Vibrio paracholerae]